MNYCLVVVFDTNIYIGIGSVVLQDVLNEERSAGVLALASAWPCLELLARVSSPHARERGRALSALRKIARHAGYTASGEARLRVHDAGEFTLVRGLFGIEPDDPLLEIGFIADLVVASTLQPLDEFVANHSEALTRIAERVRAEEHWITGLADAANSMGGSGVGTPRAPTPLDLSIVAAGLVQVLAEQYGIELHADNSGRGVQLVTQNFAVALAFVFGLIADSSRTSGVPGGANSVWDSKVAFHAARGAAINGIPALLVSNDGRLHRAAAETGNEARIIRLDDYRDLIRDPEAVAHRAQLLTLDPAS